MSPLAVPAADQPDGLDAVPSVRLLVNYTRQARPDFRVTRANAAAVATLARGFDGIPAALEAVASCLRLYEPAALCELIRPNALAFLAGSTGGDGVLRLRDRLAAAVGARTVRERRLLNRLAELPAGWSMPAAAAVTGLEPAACTRFIGELLTAGLIRADDGPNRSRLRVLNLVRAAALA